MYHGKEQGRNNYLFYTEVMHVKSFEKMIMERNLRRALNRGEFVVYYQPHVDKVPAGSLVWKPWCVGDILSGSDTPEELLALSEDNRMARYS